MKNLFLLATVLLISITSTKAQKVWQDVDTLKACVSCHPTSSASYSYEAPVREKVKFDTLTKSDNEFLEKEHKDYYNLKQLRQHSIYRVHIINTHHCALCSYSTSEIAYLVGSSDDIRFYDYYGHYINHRSILDYEQIKRGKIKMDSKVILLTKL